MKPRLFSWVMLLFGVACITPNAETGQAGGLSVAIASGYLNDMADKVMRYDTNGDGKLQQNEAAGLVTEMTADLASNLLAGAPVSSREGGATEPLPQVELDFHGGVPVAAMAGILKHLAAEVVALDASPRDGALNNNELAALVVKIGGRIVGAAIAG